MRNLEPSRRLPATAIWLSLAIGCLPGCQMFNTTAPTPTPPPIPPLLDPSQQAPIEKLKVSLPPYRVEPPDILFIDAIKVVPKSPYRISPQDVLSVNATGTLATQPIGGLLTVEPGGSIDLGPGNGRVAVAGLSIGEAEEAIERQLSRVLSNPQVAVSLAQSAGQQQIAGDHIIGPDGRINLGIYGTVYVAGMTVAEVRGAVEKHLTKFLDNPRVAVDVGSFNSKEYYVIMTTPGANFGQIVSRFPSTGNETVLDALAQLNGLSQLASKHHIWIARPAPNGCGCDQILPVNWDQITKTANTSTNYQVFPGDRIFIDSDKLYEADSTIGKLIAPFDRVFGFTTLGIQALFRLSHPQSTFGNGNNSSHW
jgi:polysaccharide biosynthesis/export protein